MQEELPLDPDEIGEPVKTEHSALSVVDANVSNTKSGQLLPSSDSHLTNASPAGMAEIPSSDGQSLSRVEKLQNHISVQCVGESVSGVREREESPVIDLTMDEDEPIEKATCDEQFVELMDDLNDAEFCSSFVNFDDNDDDDVDVVQDHALPGNDEHVESSDSEEWEGEGVDYVKTVAEMAEDVGTNDLFDPKILGKLVIQSVLQ